MTSVHEMKRFEITETPVLLFECVLPGGAVERWSTHSTLFEGQNYSARVLRHNLFEVRSAAEDGVDAASKLSVTLANADSHFLQVERSTGWKGAKLTARFTFIDVSVRAQVSDAVVVFTGICNPPEEIAEKHVRLSFTSRMNMQRVGLPEVRIQRRCPWMFPTTPEQRAKGVSGDVFSPFYRCGYSPDQLNGCGSTTSGQPFVSCNYSRSDCEARGMFDQDTASRETRRFGGVEYVPSSILAKSYGERTSHAEASVENEGRYNDFVPLVYGTGWYRPPIVFARNDGNLTHMEVLLGLGEVTEVRKVVVNGFELPSGKQANHATSTGWYNVVGYGTRNGAFNLDFQDTSGKPAGDPYGSMAVLSVVVPNRISDGSPLPRVEVLLDGLKLQTYDAAGQQASRSFTNNPAWVILDLLRRSGWGEDELDLESFAKTAAYCDEPVNTTDMHGTVQTVPRFQCNMVVRRRRSAADLIRGVRTGAGLLLTYCDGGRLQLTPEACIAVQQPAKSLVSNSTQPLNGGWPVYEFGDGSNGFGDILRSPSGEPSLRFWSRTTAESPNRYTVEFQDQFNEYQQDSLSLVDLDDSITAGHEITAALPALGIPNFNQATRVLRTQLHKTLRGNTFVEFETGLRGMGLKPGDIITLTYLKAGFDRQMFRVLRVSPKLNYQTMGLTAQLHNDDWYEGEVEASDGVSGRQPVSTSGVPRPLVGTELREDGETSFAISETYREQSDGSFDVELSAAFASPAIPSRNAPAIPMIDLSADVDSTGGQLQGARTYYYAVSAVNANGEESALSFVVRAHVAAAGNTNSALLRGLSFAAGTVAFHVYRGDAPSRMLRVAENVPVAPTWTDTGAAQRAAAPPDHNYHHANFYWRSELLPEVAATIRSANTIGNDGLGMIPNEYRGKIVRVHSGKGRGQERVAISNDATTLTLASKWDDEPDATSTFVVVDSSWQFGAMSQSSPSVFSVPNRAGLVVHVTGRSANSHNLECAPELSPVTRYRIGVAALDTDVPGRPTFALSAGGHGMVEITGIGLPSLENSASISAGSLSLHVWNELVESAPTLSTAIGPADTLVLLDRPVAVEPGTLLQIDSEVLTVIAVRADQRELEVDRGTFNTVAASHDFGVPAYPLERRIFILPFPRAFFGSLASGSYSHRCIIPNVRVVVAEMFMTNGRGNGQVTSVSYAGTTVDKGIRTLSGGQLTLQVSGILAIESAAVPPLQVDEPRAVRDVFATVAEAPTGSPVIVRVTRNSAEYCTLTINAGTTESMAVSGADRPALRTRDEIGLDIIAAGQTEAGTPGKDLTVTIRF